MGLRDPGGLRGGRHDERLSSVFDRGDRRDGRRIISCASGVGGRVHEIRDRWMDRTDIEALVERQSERDVKGVRTSRKSSFMSSVSMMSGWWRVHLVVRGSRE
jgi:hypothetical protein